jgi:Short C-terminal domain/Bacterial PH domain
LDSLSKDLHLMTSPRPIHTMTDQSRPLASKSDAELHAMQDKSLPVDQWTQVEAELGRRAQSQAASPSTPPADDDIGMNKAISELNGLLVQGERLQAVAIQRRLFALTQRRIIVAATTGRFIALTRGLLGGYTFFDVRWQDLRDISIRAGIFGADLSVTAMKSDDLGSHEHAGGSRQMFKGLRKDEAQRVYKIAQAQEQSWREKRRVRDLDELRAESGGMQFGGLAAAGAVGAQATSDPTERLRRAKEMLDAGLISDAEYEAIKARVVDTL